MHDQTLAVELQGSEMAPQVVTQHQGLFLFSRHHYAYQIVNLDGAEVQTRNDDQTRRLALPQVGL